MRNHFPKLVLTKSIRDDTALIPSLGRGMEVRFIAIPEVYVELSCWQKRVAP